VCQGENDYIGSLFSKDLTVLRGKNVAGDLMPIELN
jgi:hypothetical protein